MCQLQLLSLMHFYVIETDRHSHQTNVYITINMKHITYIQQLELLNFLVITQT